MKHKRTIGVLGGMGPEATVLYMSRMIASVRADDDADHIPLLVDNNTQVPSRIAAILEGGDIDPGPVLRGMAQRLERAGAAALVMPCNTAHYYADAIRESVNIPFLSMVDGSMLELAGTYGLGARVGVLASPAVMNTGVFDRAAAPQSLNMIYPNDQPAMLEAIKALKRSANDTAALAAVMKAARDLADKSADVLLVGCSEFSLLTGRIAEIHATLDTLDVLVRQSVRFAESD